MKTKLCLLAATLGITVTSSAATLTFTTIQHATVGTQGAVANGDYARFATRGNGYGFPATYLVMDFEIIPNDLGFSALTAISDIGIAASHGGGQHTIGRFDVFYVANSAPSIASGSTQLVYDGTYGHGFSDVSPPAGLAGLTKVSSGLYYQASGETSIPIDLSSITASLLEKINNGERLRFVFSEASDNTVSAWVGLNSDPALAPKITITATGIPEPETMVLICLAGGVGLGRRRTECA